MRGSGTGCRSARGSRPTSNGKALLDYDGMLAIARAGAADSLRSGITTTADYSFAGAAAAACNELGLRAIVYLEVFGSDPAAAERRFAETRARTTESELVRIGISPHAPYTCSLDVYRWCLSLGIPVGTHLAESADENDWLEHGAGTWSGLPAPPVAPTGKRAVATLEPVLGPDLLCAHCVDVRDDEIALLAERQVPIAHCPRSNALLGCGIAPLADLRAAGITVGLGTDSPASAPNFDLFEELRTAIYAARARERSAEALSATEALALATVDAARALRLDAEVGTLTAGKRADLTVVSLAGSPYHPVEDPAAAVVFGGSPDRVLATIVDGQTRYQKAEETQWQEVRSTASAARRQMLRTTSSVTAAAPRKHKQKAPEWQEQLFFQRLRLHAKWVFVLLAAVFGLGFVFLGIGSGANGITDALQSAFHFGGTSTGTSVSSLEKKTQKHPLDAQAWRDLATAYETKQNVAGAITALAQYTALKPKSTDDLSELANEYGQLAQQYATDYQNAQQQIANATPAGQAYAPSTTTAIGKLFTAANGLQDPIASAVTTLASTAASTAYSNYQSAQSEAQQTYEKLVKLTPNDPNAQLQLGQAAQAASDTATAIAAYKKFLKLAPHDPLASNVKQQLAYLAATAAASTTSK